MTTRSTTAHREDRWSEMCINLSACQSCSGFKATTNDAERVRTISEGLVHVLYAPLFCKSSRVSTTTLERLEHTFSICQTMRNIISLHSRRLLRPNSVAADTWQIRPLATRHQLHRHPLDLSEHSLRIRATVYNYSAINQTASLISPRHTYTFQITSGEG